VASVNDIETCENCGGVKMTHDLWQAFVQVTGAVNALLLGVILMVSPRLHRTRARQKLGLALLLYAYLLFSFTAVDNLWVPAEWWIWLVDYVLVLFASALFLDYMCGSLGGGSVSRYFYLPAILFAPLALILGTEFIVGPAIIVVILLQLTYTSLTTRLYVSTGPRLTARPRHLLLLLTGLWSLHAFQLARLLLPGSGLLFDAVPLAGAVLMLILTALVLTDSRTLRSFAQVSQQAGASPTNLNGVREYLQAERPYLDPGLTLEKLATALDLPRGELSRLISGFTDGNYYDLVNHYRVQHARQLLADPAEKRTSIEAIGLMAGFRARSTFYEAFKRDTGMTPAQYRKEAISPKT